MKNITKKSELLKELKGIAHRLDDEGLVQEANSIDTIILKLAKIDTLNFDLLERVGQKLLEDKYITQEQLNGAIDEVSMGNSPSLYEIGENGTVYVHTGGAYPLSLENYVDDDNGGEEVKPPTDGIVPQYLSDRVEESNIDEQGFVKCKRCGESWDIDTTGFDEAKEMIKQTRGQSCPSCEGQQGD